MNAPTMLSFIGIVASLMMVVFSSFHEDYMWSAVYAALAVASWILFSRALHQPQPEAAAEEEAEKEE